MKTPTKKEAEALIKRAGKEIEEAEFLIKWAEKEILEYEKFIKLLTSKK